MHLRAAVLIAAVWIGGCQRAAVDETPERVVEAFIDRMRAVHGDPERGLRAFELLAESSRANLVERAERASAVTGRPVGPQEMLVPSRFALAFEPSRFSAELRGDHARVTITGEDSERQSTEALCRREEGHWRIELPLPELPPIQRRR